MKIDLIPVFIPRYLHSVTKRKRLCLEFLALRLPDLFKTIHAGNEEKQESRFLLAMCNLQSILSFLDMLKRLDIIIGMLFGSTPILRAGFYSVFPI